MQAETRRRLKAARVNFEATADACADAIVDGSITTAEDAFCDYLRDAVEELIQLSSAHRSIKTGASDGK